jgi:hypothetical protein
MNTKQVASTMPLSDIPSYDVLMDKLDKTLKNAWNISHRIHQQSIDKWLGNFTGEALYDGDDQLQLASAAKREKQIALFLLCNFVYYNENEVKYLVRMMLNKYAHSVFSSENKDRITDKDFTRLIDETQFTFLGNISESSSYLLYHFRQENELSKECFKEKESTQNVVFIDDFSISGSQACQYIRAKMTDSSWNANRRVYVLLMIATEDAIMTLRNVQGVTVLPCIVLDEKSKAFSNTSIVFAGYPNSVKNEAQKICMHYGAKIIPNSKGMQPLGFGNGAYMFGAYYNIPDNTLPIFWSSQSNWHYLFKRYDKVYGVSGTSIGGRYV